MAVMHDLMLYIKEASEEQSDQEENYFYSPIWMARKYLVFEANKWKHLSIFTAVYLN